MFVNDNNQFTLNFLKAVNKAEQNGQSFIYSPLSITYVLGMVNDAATGQTEQELEQVMGSRILLPGGNHGRNWRRSFHWWSA